MRDLTPPLSTHLPGTWELVSRETRTADGRLLPSSLIQVVSLLMYDTSGNFSAQFMKRDRGPDDLVAPPPPADPVPNNTRVVYGYDAYFGRYVVDDEQGTVTQTLVGALSPETVGAVITRTMSVAGDELTIRVNTATPDGHAAVITLKWRRLSR